LPILEQYGRFLSRLLRGDLGYSLLNGEAVTDTILLRLAPTVILATGALVVAAILGIGLGVSAGLGVGFAKNIISLSLSMPIYWTGTLVIYAASALSLMGAGSETILPVAVLGFHAAGAIARVLQGQVSEIVGTDYVRVARAKGLRERAVIGRHVLRVALLPVVSVIALQAGFLLTGMVITESLFARPGIGRLLVERTLGQDYPVVQGIVVMSAVVYTAVNTAADGIQRALDPRLRA
jgi:peptide/nickel transport system permease protein